MVSANKKIIFIVLVGISSNIINFFIINYFRNQEQRYVKLRLQMNQIVLLINDIKIISETFINEGNEETWTYIDSQLKLLKKEIQFASKIIPDWMLEFSHLTQIINDFEKNLKATFQKVLELKKLQLIIKKKGFSFSNEIEKNIIIPFQQDEGLRIFQGKKTDSIKSRAKDTANSLVNLHTKQQVLLTELFLYGNLEDYKRKKSILSQKIELIENQLVYLGILLYEEGEMQKLINKLQPMVASLLSDENKIIQLYHDYDNYNKKYSQTANELIQESNDLSRKIDEIYEKNIRTSNYLNWLITSIIIILIGSLGSLLAINIIHFVNDLHQAHKKLKKSEEKLQISLDEKNTLLKELYHRTKNNMYIIISLLKLQSKYLKDNQAILMFKDTSDRIQAMALVHEKLYQSKNLTQVDLSEYIEELIRLLSYSFNTIDKNLQIQVLADKVMLSVEIAVPCGLILNELLSNALKYAFPDEREGKIKIILKQISDNEILLEVSDNGVGVNNEFDFKYSATLGLNTIYAIAEKQLNGKVTFKNDQGITCRIIFKIDDPADNFQPH